ncbi:golgin subfamily A member 7-like isoform X6 [Paramacrobiotus metropolitanus]|uniref:golgin subfamily A member 7-like isoform X6 n=1 Tax=Paramacrobiotus metropolitanus TaxID=2943436 RepID=UPI002445AB53|nr:golgin subfamily A member 7-like isoform X6 [Paramacrobiotus metropolitanus]
MHKPAMKPNVGRYIPIYPTASQPLPRRHRVFIERDYSQGLTLRFSSVFPQELERKMSKEDFEFVIHAFNDLYARAERITFATILENVASDAASTSVRRGTERTNDSRWSSNYTARSSRKTFSDV